MRSRTSGRGCACNCRKFRWRQATRAAASKRLGEALKAWANLPMDAELKFRMATNSLLLALLQQSNARSRNGDPRSSPRGRRSTRCPQTEVDADRLNQLMAILDYHEAKLLAARGEDTKALAQLMRATQTLNWIADQRPDAAILRSELAACYLSSATILEGMGSLGDAREVRALASVEFVKLLKDKPEDFALRLDLAGCYGAMAESAVLSGDIVGAESISKEAMKLLDQLVVEQPDNAEAVSQKSLATRPARRHPARPRLFRGSHGRLRRRHPDARSDPRVRSRKCDGFLPAGAALVAKRPDAGHGWPARARKSR